MEVLILLNDKDGLKKDELLILEGKKFHNQTDKTKQPDVWLNFYERLKDIRNYHKKYGNVILN